MRIGRGMNLQSCQAGVLITPGTASHHPSSEACGPPLGDTEVNTTPSALLRKGAEAGSGIRRRAEVSLPPQVKGW